MFTLVRRTSHTYPPATIATQFQQLSKQKELPGRRSIFTKAMDPATIIGTTSAILSFVVFTGSVISTAIKIHGNADGATLENQTFEDVVTELEQKYKDLVALTSTSLKDPAFKSDAEKSLIQNLDECTALGKRIHGLLDKTKASAKPEHLTQRVKGKIRKAIGKSETTCKPTLLEVMRAGLQTVWKKDEIDALRQQWETCMIQLNGAIFRYVSHDVITPHSPFTEYREAMPLYLDFN